MSRPPFAAALAVVAAAVSVSSEALALTVVVEPAAPVAVGQAQTFRVSSVSDAEGPVMLTWIFGDGSMAGPATDRQVSHMYQAAGHYTVIALAADDVARTSASFVQTVFHPLTAVAPANSSSIIVDAVHRQVWNVNPDNDTVSVVDSQTLSLLREIPVGRSPHALAQAPDGTIWVANQMSDEIVVLDPASGSVEARVPLPYASQPRALAIAPAGKAYVSLFATGRLVELDTQTRMITREVAVGPTPAGVSVAADGRIFVTRFISPADRGEVWVISPATFTVSMTIPLPYDTSPDSESSGSGVPNYVASFVISPDGTQAWVTAKKDDTDRGPLRDGQPTTSDNFVRAIVCVVDMATETEIIAKREDIDNRSLPVAVAFSPKGDYGYILAMASNWIGINDAYSGLNLSGINRVGNAPDGLALAPDGKLFVNAYLSREIIVYDLGLSIASIDHKAPEVLARVRVVAREVLDAKVLLGKQVFFNAADTRMSNDGYMSCASCHFGGMSDGRVWDFSLRGEGLRNTKSLLGSRGIGQGRVHWSANFDEIQDFERDIREDFEGSGFMPDAEYQARKGANGRYEPFASPAAGVSPELDALAAFFGSMDRAPRSPFRNPDGSFTAAARAGRAVFVRAGCAACHSGPELTDSQPARRRDLVGDVRQAAGRDARGHRYAHAQGALAERALLPRRARGDLAGDLHQIQRRRPDGGDQQLDGDRAGTAGRVPARARRRPRPGAARGQRDGRGGCCSVANGSPGERLADVLALLLCAALVKNRGGRRRARSCRPRPRQ